jgi:4-hydroxy-tetrahydrodipicolinate synthase
VIDAVALERYVAWMARQRVPAVAVGVHTGRGLFLTDEQRTGVLDAWKRCDHELVVGVGTPVSRSLPQDHRDRTDAVIQETVAMAEWAQREGASAVLVYPPTPLRDLPGTGERCVALHQAVAATGTPTIVFYLYGAAGGIDYSDETIDRLLGIDGVIGVKLATLDRPTRFAEVAKLAHEHQALCITGEDMFYGGSLALGADTALIGMAAACTDRMVALIEHPPDGTTEVRMLSEAIDAFARVMFAPPVDGYVQRMLWALEADGVLEKKPSDPFGPRLSRDAYEEVATAVGNLRCV